LLQIALAVQRLAHERLAAGHVAVRLDPPAADHLEAARLHVRPDAREQLRIALLDPREEERRVAREDVLGEPVEPVDRRLEGRAHLLVALRPLPQPHRVDVGVADHVHRLQLPAAHASTSSRIRWSSRTCISWMRAVESEGIVKTTSAWSAAGAPPPNSTVVAPSSCAAARPRTTF